MIGLFSFEYKKLHSDYSNYDTLATVILPINPHVILEKGSAHYKLHFSRKCLLVKLADLFLVKAFTVKISNDKRVRLD